MEANIAEKKLNLSQLKEILKSKPSGTIADVISETEQEITILESQIIDVREVDKVDPKSYFTFFKELNQSKFTDLEKRKRLYEVILSICEKVEVCQWGKTDTACAMTLKNGGKIFIAQLNKTSRSREHTRYTWSHETNESLISWYKNTVCPNIVGDPLPIKMTEIQYVAGEFSYIADLLD